MRHLSFACSFYPTVLALACLTVACGGGPKKAAAPPALPVRLQTIEPSAVTDSSDFVGNLVAHEFVQLAPKIEGRILKSMSPTANESGKMIPLFSWSRRNNRNRSMQRWAI